MSERVLLVDDEQEFTQILSERMRTRGADVDVANNGMEALEKVKEKSYDAVVLDLGMPEMDGIATLELMLKDNPDLQVIFLTGQATLEKGLQAVKMGAAEFLEKPAGIEDLMEKIKAARAKKMLLLEKKAEEGIKDILGTMGW
jgi:DNA-binding NtrC family response regulator